MGSLPNQGCPPDLRVQAVHTGSPECHRDLLFQEALPDSPGYRPEVIAQATEIQALHKGVVVAPAAEAQALEVVAARTVEVPKQARRAVIPDHLQAAVQDAGSKKTQKSRSFLTGFFNLFLLQYFTTGLLPL